jgi:hypothetical protein
MIFQIFDESEIDRAKSGKGKEKKKFLENGIF